MADDNPEDVVRPGEVIAGRYRVERVLGAGGMGFVVAARHLELKQRVALKFMHARRAQKPSSRERFLREARAAVRLRSQHVAKVLDVGTMTKRSGRLGSRVESPYIVMEYLEGRDLEAHLAERGTLPLEEVVAYVIQACEGVAEAHALGMVHRDLKPANLFLTKKADGSPCIKVLDFGISKLADEDADRGSLTRSNAVFGSPAYMSPEQMKSAKDVDGRADIWSLGVIFYELLTGKPPFDADTVTELCAKVLQEEPGAPSRLLDVPAGLDAIVARCLAKDRKDRYATAAELAAALVPFGPARCAGSAERIADVAREAAASGNASEVEPQVSGAPTDAGWGTDGETRGSGSVPKLVLAGVGLVGAIGLAAFLWPRAPHPEGTTATSESPVPAPASAAATPTTAGPDAGLAEVVPPTSAASPATTRAPAVAAPPRIVRPAVSASAAAAAPSAPKFDLVEPLR